MKWVINDRLKHQLVGMIVVLALIVIFFPALMKHSNQRFDEKMSLSFQLPKKPDIPNVSLVDKKHMFKELKIATVSLPPQNHVHTNVSKAMPLSAPVVQTAQTEPVSSKLLKIAQMSSNHFYTIQLATFAHQANAEALVADLRTKGFEASAQKINRKQGDVYQVIVGQLKQRDDAIDLQKKLVDNTRLNGLIIRSKVS